MLLIPFTIYLQFSQTDTHRAYFCDLTRIFADSLNQWTPQVLTVDQHRPTCRIPRAKHISCSPGIHQGQVLKQKCWMRVSNVGFRCELDTKLLSHMDVKVISLCPMGQRSLQDKTSDFLFLSLDFALSLGPAEQWSCTFGSFPCNSDCSSTTFSLFPWNRQCL